MTPEQIARAKEFKADFCALTDDDFANPNFLSWMQQYSDYVKYGAGTNLVHPPHRPPF